jgi:hypothetical protein
MFFADSFLKFFVKDWGVQEKKSSGTPVRHLGASASAPTPIPKSIPASWKGPH